MLLSEAHSFMTSRLNMCKKDYAELMPEYMEALEIACKAIKKQIEIQLMIDDLETVEHKSGQFYSHDLVMDLLKGASVLHQEEDENVEQIKKDTEGE